MATPGVYAFERIDETLPYMPLAARRVLDGLGRRLSLEAWLSLPVDARCRIVQAGASERVDPAVLAVLDAATPRPAPIEAPPEPSAESPPADLVATLRPHGPVEDGRWRALRPLDRYALVKCASKPEKLASAYTEIVGLSLSHLSHTGAAHMVDVSGKAETARRAVASACVRTTAPVVEAIASGGVAKGDVLAAARIAGILAAKRTPELVPLCHPVRTTRVAIDFDATTARGEVLVLATVEAVDRTGVEMEAMVAASVASLTIYDMIKSADRWASIGPVRLESKSGGKSGEQVRPPKPGG